MRVVILRRIRENEEWVELASKRVSLRVTEDVRLSTEKGYDLVAKRRRNMGSSGKLLAKLWKGPG
jgi:hypothetical protein